MMSGIQIMAVPLVDDAQLELVVLEHLQEVRLGHLQTLEGLLLLHDLQRK